MTREQMLEKIQTIQPYITSLVEKNYVKFLNPATEVQILEDLYNEITGRKYLKFNSGCGSCVKEALIICDNYRKKALKEIEMEESAKVEETEVEKSVEPQEPVQVEATKPIKPKPNGRRSKPKQ
ncbi:hypothetical protein [Sphingobacterium chungjuense]|uniref:hypothetical protein n=1 Tax=Sphingobacterium chungjuense TaxID=2675553 RepID=UPI00140E14C1|nr:hypothetical protein [Sphingobacterium chungjuense]